MTLEGRAALVTGGGRGIGRGIALAMAEAGADVAITYRRDEEAASQTVAEIESMGRKAAAFRAEASDRDAIKAAVEGAIERLGKVDILVNNAGTASRGNSVFDTDPEEMRRVVTTHVFAAFDFTQAVLPNMRQQPRGDIIMISSVAAEGLNANGSPYNMAKTAMEALAITLSKEERPNGIRVNILRPGLVETEMGRRLARATRGVQDIKDLYPSSPFGRVGQPSDLANAAVFLTSAAGEYITGATIKVSGG
jgi:NAD(P)-dependent dehydrogenase (short-subunit alcohol dehydrogenase family)